jgi:tyramine---L-glutamate ligase
VRVFAFEFFSGGGLVGRPLPPSLAREGDMMLAALVGELAGVPGVEVVVSRDPRLPSVPGCTALLPLPDEDPVALYRRGLADADAGWPTASESGRMLERLAQATVDEGRVLLGCRPDAVRLAGSKRATARLLRERGIQAVPTVALGDAIPPGPGRWVVKPDDGAGCEGMRIVDDWTAAAVGLATGPDRLVAQPWIDGDPLSLSLLCADGCSRLLSCNRQEIAVEDTGVSLRAVHVNAWSDSTGDLARLGERIAAAMPGLWGYVGVDLVLTSVGPVVLEINPRLTTSYAGLGRALRLNVAALVLDLVRDPDRALRPVTHPSDAIAEIRLEPSNVP